MRNDFGFVQQGGQGDMPSASDFCKLPLVGNLQKWSLWTSIGSACYSRNGMQAGFSLHRQADQNQYGSYRPYWRKNSEKVLVNRKEFCTFTFYYNKGGWGEGEWLQVVQQYAHSLRTGEAQKMYDAVEGCLAFFDGQFDNWISQYIQDVRICVATK